MYQKGLMVFAFPMAHWQLLLTTNGLERLNQEIQRRTRVARLFPNEASCVRLVTAVVMGISSCCPSIPTAAHFCGVFFVCHVSNRQIVATRVARLGAALICPSRLAVVRSILDVHLEPKT